MNILSQDERNLSDEDVQAVELYSGRCRGTSKGGRRGRGRERLGVCTRARQPHARTRPRDEIRYLFQPELYYYRHVQGNNRRA